MAAFNIKSFRDLPAKRNQYGELKTIWKVVHCPSALIKMHNELKPLKSAEQAYYSNSAMICNLHEPTALQAIAIKVVDILGLMLNVTNNLTLQQGKMYASLIIEMYSDLKLNEIERIVKNGISGIYGEIYNRVDVQVLMTWTTKYYEKRSEIFSHLRENQHREYKLKQSGDTRQKEIKTKNSAMTKKQKDYAALQTREIIKQALCGG